MSKHTIHQLSRSPRSSKHKKIEVFFIELREGKHTLLDDDKIRVGVEGVGTISSSLFRDAQIIVFRGEERKVKSEGRRELTGTHN